MILAVAVEVPTSTAPKMAVTRGPSKRNLWPPMPQQVTVLAGLSRSTATLPSLAHGAMTRTVAVVSTMEAPTSTAQKTAE
eukprot:scaffold2087_cov153-Pinguiococcus_pyrenoidosus.AAC.3